MVTRSAPPRAGHPSRRRHLGARPTGRSGSRPFGHAAPVVLPEALRAVRQYSQPLQRLDEEGGGITPPRDLRTVAPRANAEKVQKRTEPRAAPVAHITQAQVEMIDIAPKPATADPEPVFPKRRDVLPRGAANKKLGEVDTGIDGELQRAPEPAVRLHHNRSASSHLALAFDHGDASQIQGVQQANTGTF